MDNLTVVHATPATPAPSPIETTLTRILGDGDSWSTHAARHGNDPRSRPMRELFGLNPDGRLVPLFALGCYAVGGAR